MAEYLLTPAAESDLEIIWEYTSQQWGVDQAIRYTDILFDAFAELAKSPQAAPVCDHIRPGYRRRSVERHMIYYRISNFEFRISNFEFRILGLSSLESCMIVWTHLGIFELIF